jgi:hypothetical protein
MKLFYSVLLCSAFFVAGCGSGKKVIDFSSQIETGVSTGKFDFNDHVPDWDALYVLRPYSQPKTVLEPYGVGNSSAADGVDIEVRDDINLLVAVKDSNVVAFAVLKRLSCDLADKEFSIQNTGSKLFLIRVNDSACEFTNQRGHP